jgi:hypothetical protein
VDDPEFRRNFFRALNDAALEPDDPRYVPIYDDKRISADDPVVMMQTTVEWTIESSVQLFSGFRGTGKSTELRRLRMRLAEADYRPAVRRRSLLEPLHSRGRSGLPAGGRRGGR